MKRITANCKFANEMKLFPTTTLRRKFELLIVRYVRVYFLLSSLKFRLSRKIKCGEQETKMKR